MNGRSSCLTLGPFCRTHVFIHNDPVEPPPTNYGFLWQPVTTSSIGKRIALSSKNQGNPPVTPTSTTRSTKVSNSLIS
ncbi:hypothetical protein EG68_11315 [Paragonimus skrjabini miyazakii]|uniref:Uncharacterized protein n=1 Tax=Paragonimus skrjabini miyazakii TaxID=59628 RepID=A0A8S9YE29_9TREM|nr:hypothetical protein EG68_11315 [Paragonimus skrjabini miyazakii]